MKRLVLLALAASCFAKSSFEIAQQLVNDPSKDAKLAVLFNQGDVRPNIKQISQTLKMNGLLNYSYPEGTRQHVDFYANTYAAIMLKAISNAFEQIGINYYLPSKYEKHADMIKIGFMVNSKTMVDPGALYLMFSNMGIKMVDAHRNGADFKYELDFSNAHIDAQAALNKGANLQLKKPFDDYFISLNNLQKITINANTSDIWYPKILFLDKNLNLISSFSSNQRSRSQTINVPNLSAYAIIGDKFSLENIKHGLEIAGE